MEGNKEENEKEEGLIVGESEPCPCGTTPKETKWSEVRWKKHWASLKASREDYERDKARVRAGHLKRIGKLHKESRG